MPRTSRSRAPAEDVTVREFRRLINMSPAQIRAWHRDPRSREASFPRTRAELPLLARIKETPPARWTPAMWSKARRAVAFVKRHEAQMVTQGHQYGTGIHYTRKRVIALLNWGRRSPGVRVEGL